MDRFRRSFWQPPRAHGDIIEDRSVSFLELFYDLVYVVVIAGAAHHLAAHVSWQGAFDFAVLFGLVWIGWLNGTLYHELHAREDGRSRTFVFAQMLALGVVAVYIGDATGESGEEFAISFSIFLFIIAYLWYSVRRVDEDPAQRRAAGQYTGALVILALAILVSAAMPSELRFWTWTAVVVIAVIGMLVFPRLQDGAFDDINMVGESLVERFGLFTIIVLGEVVVGVVDGLSEAVASPVVVVTGLLGLMIGFAWWWTYFDFVGRRMPRDGMVQSTLWMVTHMPATMAIAASGAAMVSLIEHGADIDSPAATAWLLGGSVALGFVSLAMVIIHLADYPRVPELYRSVLPSLFGGAAAALLVAWVQPRPWVLALSIFAIQSIVWWIAIASVFRTENRLGPSPRLGRLALFVRHASHAC